jgi:protein-L-isoaspartate(D-aspartate) O-methyltransferase
MSIDYAKARETMVEQQVRPWDVLDVRVLDAIATIPREAFVPEALRALAYADTALPIGHGELMMKPVLEGRTLQSLLPAANECVLEIGTGSGYLTACLARLSREVVSLERHADLADNARARLRTLGMDANAGIECADVCTWKNSRQFDLICVTGAVDRLPREWLQWLKPDGRLFVVQGRSPAMDAVLMRHGVNGIVVQSLFETDLQYLVGTAPQPEFIL